MFMLWTKMMTRLGQANVNYPSRCGLQAARNGVIHDQRSYDESPMGGKTMMQQRMVTFLCLPVFCLAVWALSPSAHAAGNRPPAQQFVNADETAVPDQGDDELFISDEVDDGSDVLSESADPCDDGIPAPTTGSLVCFYPEGLLEVRDTLADGYAAYIQWNYGRDNHGTPRNRSEVGGNGKSLFIILPPENYGISFRACRNVPFDYDNCGSWKNGHVP